MAVWDIRLSPSVGDFAIARLAGRPLHEVRQSYTLAANPARIHSARS